MASKVAGLASRILNRAPKLPQLSASAERILQLIPPSVQPTATIMDLGCTEPSLYAQLGATYKQVTGVVQLDPADPADARALAVLKPELQSFKVQCDVMPTLYSLPPYKSIFDCAVSEDMLSYAPENPESIVKGVHEALKPGGVFVGEMSGDGSMETFRMACYDVLSTCGIDAAAYDPFYFPTAKELQLLLESQGFTVRRVKSVSVRQRVPSGPNRNDVALVDYLHTGMAQKFLLALKTPDEQRKMVSEIVRLCHASMFRDRMWSYMAVRLQFVAERQK